jgi:hypothetical protein
MVGRSYALSHDRADIQLVTYADLTWRKVAPQSVVFDAFTSNEAKDHRETLRALSHMRDVIRIGVDEHWPDNPLMQLAALEMVRPGEFDMSLPLPERYPVDSLVRFREHANAYLHVRTAEQTQPTPSFRRSAVRLVSPSPSQILASDRVFDRFEYRDPVEVLAELLEIVTVGPPQATSPAVSAAAELMSSAAATNRSVAVITRHRRAVSLLRSMLRPLGVSVWEPGSVVSEDARVLLVRFDADLPSFRAFDEVIVLDYPWSLGVLDAAVGSSVDQHGPDVTVVHTSGTIADRVVLLAARRAELAHVGGATGVPSDDEIEYLLAPR